MLSWAWTPLGYAFCDQFLEQFQNISWGCSEIRLDLAQGDKVCLNINFQREIGYWIGNIPQNTINWFQSNSGYHLLSYPNIRSYFSHQFPPWSEVHVPMCIKLDQFTQCHSTRHFLNTKYKHIVLVTLSLCVRSDENTPGLLLYFGSIVWQGLTSFDRFLMLNHQ